MDTRWTGGTPLAHPGKHPLGIYEILNYEGEIIGYCLIGPKTKQDLWSVTLHTNKEIDLGETDLVYMMVSSRQQRSQRCASSTNMAGLT